MAALVVCAVCCGLLLSAALADQNSKFSHVTTSGLLGALRST